VFRICLLLFSYPDTIFVRFIGQRLRQPGNTDHTRQSGQRQRHAEESAADLFWRGAHHPQLSRHSARRPPLWSPRSGPHCRSGKLGMWRGEFTNHRYLMSRLSLQVVYLWRHVMSIAPPSTLWWSNLEILFSPLHRSSPFIGGLRCQAIQTEQCPYIAERTHKAVSIVRCQCYQLVQNQIAFQKVGLSALNRSGFNKVFAKKKTKLKKKPLIYKDFKFLR
jgi:hypothetical protein